MRQDHLFIVIVAFFGCFIDSVSAGNPVQLTNSVIAQDQALLNDEDAHRNLRRYVVPKKESGDSEEEERAFQWLSKLKARFGKNPNVAKTLEKNSDLAQALQKNPQVINQIDDLQKKPGFIQRIANNPAVGKLIGRLTKNPVKFNEQNLRNIGRMTAKTTTRGGGSLGHKMYIALGIFVVLVFFIGGPALLLARKSG